MTEHDKLGGWAQWGVLMFRHRWLVVALWLLIIVGSVPMLGRLGENLTAGGFEVPGSQSAEAAAAKRDDLPGEHPRTSVLVLHSDGATVDDPAYHRVLTDVRATLLRSPGVAEVSDPLKTPGAVSPDARTAIVRVSLDESQDAAFAHATTLEKAVDATLSGRGIRGDLAGDAPFYASFQETASEDLKHAETFIAPLSALILVVALGGLLIGWVPLVVAGMALVVSLGAVSVLAEQVTVNILTQNIATMIGLGVGIDYTLFVVRPFRRALARTKDPCTALSEALGECGRGVSVSALIVATALSGTLVVDVPAYRSMGLGAMLAVGAAAAAALTVLPALLGCLGRRVEWGRVRQPGTHARRRWPSLATWPIRHPWVGGIGAALLLGLLALPGVNMKLGTSGPAILPEDAPPRVAAERLSAGFGGGAASPVEVVMRFNTPPDDPATRVGVATVTSAIAGRPEVVQVRPQLLSTGPRRSTALLTVVTRHGPQAEEVIELVQDLRTELPPLVGTETDLLVGGEPAQNVDLNDQVAGSVPAVIAWVLMLSFGLLLIAFRSILVAVKAVATNLLSVLATYGVLVLVFQHGYGAGLLSLAAPGYIEVFLPLFLFCILFGLSMDYEVFLLTEVRAERLRGATNAEATSRAVLSTAGVITTAAAIMVVVFTGFALTTLTPIQAIGFGLAVAVLLDATVVRLVLVPAALVLAGERNWWLPGWLEALLDRLRAPRRRSDAAPALEKLPAAPAA